MRYRPTGAPKGFGLCGYFSVRVENKSCQLSADSPLFAQSSISHSRYLLCASLFCILRLFARSSTLDQSSDFESEEFPPVTQGLPFDDPS
jgi:hypothetical protein